MRYTSAAKYQSGFGLVELLVVIAIIGLFVGIVLPNYMEARRQAHDTDRYRFAMDLKEALARYYLEHRYYPSDHFNDRTCQILRWRQDSTEEYNAGVESQHPTCFNDIRDASGFGPQGYGLFELFPEPSYSGDANSYSSQWGGEYKAYIPHYTDPGLEHSYSMHYCTDGDSNSPAAGSPGTTAGEYVIYVPLEQEGGNYCYIHSDNSDTFAVGGGTDCTQTNFKYWDCEGAGCGAKTKVDEGWSIIGSCEDYFSGN